MPGVTAKRLIVAVAALVVAVVVGVGALELSGRTAFLSSRGSEASSPSARAASSGNLQAGRAKWIVEENAKPGTKDWQLRGPLNQGNIGGYADVTSATRGQEIKLYVSTDAPSYRVEAYRMGHYGGTQARMIWHSESLPGRRQAEPFVDPDTNMVEARWQPSLTVKPDKSWPPGNYLFKLDASNGYGQYIPLALRDDESKAALLVMNAVTTWQAYNTWGDHSLYEGSSGRAGYGAAGRSQVVSFDRPYKNDSGSGDFLGNELPLVSLVERLGLDVTYITNIDLHERPELLARHRALVTLGHDEYWTLEMRDSVERARDSGMNIVFFGANAVFRAIRLEPSALGPARHEVNYRTARDDPMYRVLDDSRMTVSWRDPPINRPESDLTGTYYECNPVDADMVISDASSWVFQGTGLQNGDVIKGIVGSEYDRYFPTAPQPPGEVQILAHSPLRCRGDASFADMTYYTTPSGAGVLSTGTNWWISRLGGPRCLDNECDPRVADITANILRAFSTGPVGRIHPSRSNYAEVIRSGRAATSSSTTTSTTRRPSTTTTTIDDVPAPSESGPPLPFPTTPLPTTSQQTIPGRLPTSVPR